MILLKCTLLQKQNKIDERSKNFLILRDAYHAVHVVISVEQIYFLVIISEPSLRSRQTHELRVIVIKDYNVKIVADVSSDFVSSCLINAVIQFSLTRNIACEVSSTEFVSQKNIFNSNVNSSNLKCSSGLTL